MHRIRYWEVVVAADVEGRTSKVAASFANEEAAIDFTKTQDGQDTYGNPGRVVCKDLILFDSAEEVDRQ